MESLSIAGGIIKVAKAIVKAASGVRQCKSRCQYLARRVEVIAELVREFEAAPSDSATRTRVLDRLRDALEEALEVVQSCRSFTKLLLAGRSTSSRIDDAERKINNCLLELGVANDVRLLGLGSQCQSQSQQATTAAGRVAVHDGVVPRTNTVVNNSGIVMNINGKCANVSLKQKSSMRTYISAGGSVSTYFGDSSSRNGIKEDSVAAIHNNSSLVSASAGGSHQDMYQLGTTTSTGTPGSKMLPPCTCVVTDGTTRMGKQQPERASRRQLRRPPGHRCSPRQGMLHRTCTGQGMFASRPLRQGVHQAKIFILDPQNPTPGGATPRAQNPTPGGATPGARNPTPGTARKARQVCLSSKQTGPGRLRHMAVKTINTPTAPPTTTAMYPITMIITPLRKTPAPAPLCDVM